MLEGEAGVLAKVFQGDQVAVGKGMAFPHVDVDAAFQDGMEFQVGLVENLLQDFVVEVIEVQDSNLTFEIFYIGNKCHRSWFRGPRTYFIHSELLDHFHEGIDREGIMLHGNTEFLLGLFLGNIFDSIRRTVLPPDGRSPKILPLRNYRNSTVGPSKKLPPISSSNSRIADERLWL